jgi:hypothetical protein
VGGGRRTEGRARGVDPMVSGALSQAAAAGLTLGAGAAGCGLLVLGLTALAVRRGARAERPRKPARAGTTGAAAPGPEPDAAAVETGTHDPYPPQPYSAHEPRSHKPYSRPYRMPRQGQHGTTNGHSPGAGLPSNPYSPPGDES